MKILYEDNDIIVKSTGHDYDFIATIENKNDRPLMISAKFDDDFSGVHINMSPHDWTGLLADQDGRQTLEAILDGNFAIVRYD